MVAGAAGCSLIGIAGLFAAAAELPFKTANNDVYAGNLNQASQAFETASSLRPRDADMAMLAGQSAPVNPQIWLQSGLVEYAAGATLNAISMVEKAVELAPDATAERGVLAALQDELAAQRSNESNY